MPWKVIRSETPLDTPWIKVQKDVCRVRTGKKIDYYTFTVHDWGVLVAFTPNREIVLLRQYRHPLRKTVLELPGGNIEKNEDPIQSIRREFLEETGFELGRIKRLGTWYPIHGRSASKVFAFAAKTKGPARKSHRDPEEEIKVVLKKSREVLKLIRQGKIREAPQIAAILAVREKHPDWF